MSGAQSYLWLDGALAKVDRARIDPRDRGFLLADGVFETLRAVRGTPCFFDRHWRRLEFGAAVLGIPVPFSAATVAEACRLLLRANGLAEKPASLRITLTRGPGPRGLRPPPKPDPTLLIAAHPRDPAPLPPARALLLRGPRRNETSPLSRIKSLARTDSVLAQQHAAAAGVEEALFLNTRGCLACAAAANLFLLRQRELLTPPLADGVLGGVTRARVIEIAAELGIGVRERSLLPAELFDADGAFLTNSLIGVRPLLEVDGEPIGDPAGRELIRRLQQALEDGS